MARWQFLKDGVPTADPVFDDGLVSNPGDPDFSTDAVVTQTAALGADSFNYVGVSILPET